MSPISSAPPANTFSTQTLTPLSNENENENDKADNTLVNPSSSSDSPLVVTISAEGKEKLAGEQQKNADIDATNLPDGIKKYLKSIRELQEKIEKKLEELQAAMSDHSLSDKDRESKVSKIQLELSVLSSTLTSITNDLRQKEVEMRLQGPDLKLVNSLMSPR